MNLSIEDNKVNETIFYLSELKDVETIASVGETFYMNAKTKMINLFILILILI